MAKVLEEARDAGPSEAMFAALNFSHDAAIGPGRFVREAITHDWRILLDAALSEGT